MASRVDLDQIAISNFKLKFNVFEENVLSVENVANRIRTLLFLLVGIQILCFLAKTKRHSELLGYPGLKPQNGLLFARLILNGWHQSSIRHDIVDLLERYSLDVSVLSVALNGKRNLDLVTGHEFHLTKIQKLLVEE